MLKIDFHAHILPGADHGSDRIETTMAQLELIRSSGVDAVVATPHFYPNQDSPERFLARRARAVEALLAAAPKGGPKIFLGAEVAVCPHLERMEKTHLQRLCIAGTNVILLEMPMTTWNDALIRTVTEIRELGFCPVIAHVDRYAAGEVAKVLRRDLPVQLNASAFRGLLHRGRYLKLAMTPRVWALGSDLHRSDEKGYEAFSRLLADGRFAPVFARTAELLRDALPLSQTPEGAGMGGMTENGV